MKLTGHIRLLERSLDNWLMRFGGASVIYSDPFNLVNCVPSMSPVDKVFSPAVPSKRNPINSVGSLVHESRATVLYSRNSSFGYEVKRMSDNVGEVVPYWMHRE